MSKPDESLAHYEGLIFTTTAMIVGFVEEDFDDIQQAFRIKVWNVLRSYNPANRSGTSREDYVFMCVTNLKKDMLKRKRHDLLMIEDIAPSNGDSFTANPSARDRFENHYLCESAERAYAEVEDKFDLPASLSAIERQVILGLYTGYMHMEIAQDLGLTPGQMEGVVKRVRLKLADWRPSTAAPAPELALAA